MKKIWIANQPARNWSGSYRAAVTCGVLLILMFAPAVSWAKKVHLIIVADTVDPLIGADCKKDLKNLYARFGENIAESELDIFQLEGKRASRTDILKTISELRTASDDAIVFAYAGHGIFDVTKKSDGSQKGHALQLPHGPPGKTISINVPGTAIKIPANSGKLLYRSDLVAALRKKNPRLLVLWTDCCNQTVQIVTKRVGKGRDGFSVPQTTSPLFKSLLFDASGIVDLATSKPGELAWGDVVDKKGGIATVAFCDFLTKNRQATMTWDQAFPTLKSGIDKGFRRSFPSGARAAASLPMQHTQTLYKFEWQLGSQRTVGEKGPFGVTVVADPGNRGVKVTKVVPGSAAAKRVVAKINGRDILGGLTAGDIITHIEGTPVTTEELFGTAFDNAGPLMRIRFLNAAGNFASVSATVDLSK